MNGQYLKSGIDWAEVGTISSNRIQILQNFVVGDTLTFRDDSEGGIYFGAGGGGGTTSLQNAYDNGNTIVAASGAPVTITGTIGQKLLSVQGDMEVTGLIDPSGVELTPQASTPLNIATQAGIWVDSATNDLMYQKGDGSTAAPIDIGGTKIWVLNASGVTISRMAPIAVDGSGNMIAANPRQELGALTTVGILNSDTNHLANGDVVANGIIRNI